MKKIILSTVAVACLASSSLFAADYALLTKGVAKNIEQISIIKNDNMKTKERVSNNKTSITALEKDTVSLSGAVVSNKSAITANKSTADAQNQEVLTRIKLLESSLNTNSSNDAVMVDKMPILSEGIMLNEQEIAKKAKQINSMNANLAKQTVLIATKASNADVNSLTKRITDLENLSGDAKGETAKKISHLEKLIEGLQAKVASYENKQEEAEKVIVPEKTKEEIELEKKIQAHVEQE